MTDVSLITSTGIIAIVRGDFAAQIGTLAEALYAGGVRAVEVTLNSPDALGMIGRLARDWQGRMLIGAGTVLTLDALDAAADAGASFFVSPDVFPPLIERAVARGMGAFPGAYTPTEIRMAVRAGARFVKLFPAMPAGAAYLRQIRAPLDDVQFVPTGGITADNIGDFVRAGAAAFGVGGGLVPRGFDGSAAHVHGVTETARTLIGRFTAARDSSND